MPVRRPLAVGLLRSLGVRLDGYFASLLDGALPLPPWVLALVLLTLLLANFYLALSLRDANSAQHFVTVEDWTPFRRVSQPKYLVVQIVFVAIVFFLALDLGGAGYVFLAGGLLVFLACHFGLNLQGLLAARGLANPNAATGALTYSTAAAFRHTAHRILGAAVTCLISGLALGHLALLGGALFLAAAAFGSWRRAQKVRAQP
jgi:hypothetical protein